MPCSDIMNSHPVTVPVGTSVGSTIAILCSGRYRSLPVVDADGKMLGQFGVHRVLELAVPTIATLGVHGKPLDIGFLRDKMSDLRRRLADEWDQPVERYLEKPGRVLHPDDAMTKVVLAVYGVQGNIPVVDPETKALVGIVSYWDVINHLLDGLD